MEKGKGVYLSSSQTKYRPSSNFHLKSKSNLSRFLKNRDTKKLVRNKEKEGDKENLNFTLKFIIKEANTEEPNNGIYNKY